SRRKHIRTQQQHRPRFRFREWIAQTNRMTTHKVELQLKQIVFRDADVRQLAEAGVDAVHRAALGYDVLDHGSRTLDPRARIVRENNLFPVLSNVDDLLESELLTVELKH